MRIKLSKIIHQTDVKYQIKMGSLFLRSMNQQNEYLINQITPVIQEIDKKLKDRFGYTSSGSSQ